MAVRTATLSGTVNWSDGSAFTGYVYVGLALPVNSDGVWTKAYLKDQSYPPVRIPRWTTVCIEEGVFDPQTKLYFNADLTPPGTKYLAYWYDQANRRIYPATGATAALFTIDATPFAITLPTLTLPTVASEVPTPEGT